IGGTFVGCIATGFAVGGFGVGPFGIVWPQGGETVLGGAGNVAQFAVAGSPCPAGVPNVGAMTGNCSSAAAQLAGVGPIQPGGYLRVGAVELVVLNCNISINGAPGAPFTIAVAGLFFPACAPPPGVCENGVTVPIQHAAFVGAFATVEATVT